MDINAFFEKIDVEAILAKITDLLAKIDFRLSSTRSSSSLPV